MKPEGRINKWKTAGLWGPEIRLDVELSRRVLLENHCCL